MVVSTVQVRNMRYEVGRNRQAATGQLIINFVYFLINFVYLFVRRYFPDTPRQDAVHTTRRWLPPRRSNDPVSGSMFDETARRRVHTSNTPRTTI
jgi:hypothetical protein